MRNQKRWIGIAALTGVTVVALTASILIKKNLSGEPAEVISITEEGANLGIKQIEVLTNSDGSVSGYKANVETKGFGAEPIVMAITFNATADEVTNLEIISQTETDGLGSKITEEAFLSQFKGFKLPAYLEGMTVATDAANEPEATKAPEAEEVVTEDLQLIDGTYEVVAPEANNGWTSQVSLTVADGKITSVVWDMVDAEGNSKTVQSQNGEYVMTEDGPTWAEQAEALAAYVIENQSVDTLNVNAEGKTDVVASVSISVNEFVAQVKEGLLLASGQVKPAASLIDGTYEVVAPEANNGWTSQVSLTVAEGKITSVVWDMMDAEGNSKTVQSQNGEYVMTEDGATWAEQAEALAAHVIENQSVDTLNVNAEGKTDVVASVSISVNEFVSQVKECLELASGEVKAPALNLADGTYEATGAEGNDWTSKVSVTVSGGVITEVVWDMLDAEGNAKSVLSENGEYVMSENGPTWAEQAKALAAYVVEHQDVTSITMDEAGKTDAVASVSISVNEFVELVENCLAQAGGTSVEAPVETPDTGSATEDTDSSETMDGTKVDAVSGATVSTTAVVTGINNAYEYLQRYVVK